MILGFTGTRRGMTPRQKEAWSRSVGTYGLLVELHHGGCLGADEDAHLLAHLVLGHQLRVHIHWSDREEARATWLEADVYHDPMPPLDRNRVIVAACDLLVAAPAQKQEILRSGTWSTVRAARRLGKPVTILEP